MDKKDQVSGSNRISDAMLDEMLAGTDAATVFHSGELLLGAVAATGGADAGCRDGGVSGSGSGTRPRRCHPQRAPPQDGTDGRWIDAAGGAAGSTGDVRATVGGAVLSQSFADC